MDPLVIPLDSVAKESPVPLIFRRRVFGDRILFAEVHLEKGCHVAPHSHESEQVAYVVSGRVRWNLGAKGSDEYREVETTGGHVVVLPSNFPHGVDALEDTLIIDLLSPPGEMGIDRQGAH